MSRIGKMPIAVPAGVTVTIEENNVVTVKGPKGELKQQLCPSMNISQNGNEIVIERFSEEKEFKALHGLTRALLSNMVVGVTDGFSKELEINGSGYKAEKKGTTLVLNLGYSHDIKFEEGDGVTFDVPAPNKIIVKGIDRQKVGQIAAQIREKRPPEPYLGKGVKYKEEHIRRKAGKAGK